MTLPNRLKIKILIILNLFETIIVLSIIYMSKHTLGILKCYYYYIIIIIIIIIYLFIYLFIYFWILYFFQIMSVIMSNFQRQPAIRK